MRQGNREDYWRAVLLFYAFLTVGHFALLIPVQQRFFSSGNYRRSKEATEDPQPLGWQRDADLAGLAVKAPRCSALRRSGICWRRREHCPMVVQRIKRQRGTLFDLTSVTSH